MKSKCYHYNLRSQKNTENVQLSKGVPLVKKSLTHFTNAFHQTHPINTLQLINQILRTQFESANRIIQVINPNEMMIKR